MEAKEFSEFSFEEFQAHGADVFQEEKPWRTEVVHKATGQAIGYVIATSTRFGSFAGYCYDPAHQQGRVTVGGYYSPFDEALRGVIHTWREKK